jgi:hypothetical protein
VYWQHNAMLIDGRRGNCVWDIAGVSRPQAEQIAAGMAAGRGPTENGQSTCGLAQSS